MKKPYTQKTEEEIQFHNFINDFSVTAKDLNQRFDNLIALSQSNIDDLKNTKDQLDECERSFYRTMMNLDEQYEEFIKQETERREKEQRKARKREKRIRSFFTTSPYV